MTRWLDGTTLTLREALRGWTDTDVASFELGACLGLWAPGLESFQAHKSVFWTNNVLGDHLELALRELVAAGVLEAREGFEQFRWSAKVADSYQI